MSIATPADVETSLLRPLLQREQEYAPALLERAEGILLSRIHNLLDRAERDTTFHDLVAATEAEAVARVLRNPQAIRQESEGNYSYTINYQVASGLLDILDEEWQRLGAIRSVGSIAPITDGYLRSRHIVDVFQRDLN